MKCHPIIEWRVRQSSDPCSDPCSGGVVYDYDVVQGSGFGASLQE
jgi:hypothetical protein